MAKPAAADDPGTLARFAEHIANEVPIPEAARRIGVSHSTGKRMMRRLAREVGE